ncbi:CfaE/CblD family pilus tip adhesin [Pseudomonas savastanoi]|uniref:CfaE/CblD family pilus tip adhesin n=1 Tax=Pseudomonas savastanoi TaxID=29438 RepID=UPI000A5555A1|nr:CfaE/CblD family pilus tip adhesin [Pseudomonas savastanoi]
MSATFAINSSASNSNIVAQSLLTVRLSKEQIESLPIGGEWYAKLILHQWAYRPNRTKLVTWTAGITINLVDNKNIQVYLPNYSTASPTVDLDLKRKPSPDRSPILAGDVKIDACLYDGYNAQSKKYDITFSSPSSKGENFYITNTMMNPDPKLSNTIPYQVWVSTPAAPSVASKKVLPNTLFSFTGVNESTPKLVTLPNIPNPVYCTPWLINLKTADISQNTQAPGHYQGSLHLKFTPSSSSL